MFGHMCYTYQQITVQHFNSLSCDLTSSFGVVILTVGSEFWIYIEANARLQYIYDLEFCPQVDKA